ncbi:MULTISPECIES: phosphohistidine phosphatase SixA [Vibrio]|uniref:Phosphohistidine phosphatase SixA n=1 Tax=Vibrio casei TaxID=673372 RepID=A0A368LNX8_9VIBR|nr:MULTISPECIES: phosphohistidine phosphatase SixA [Vibrio]RCS73610.1 phosphohistidine phosphatase SixA [Vibrio casei]SJN16927.1 Phosphohistidine phosphatase SixA [Vibrio casei]HBV76338.1 phosphohistidine phosphatase SixA [Vibrio sp.]
MHIYIMRHGDAETFAASDAERPLSQMGHDQSLKVAQRCRDNGQEEFDLVLVSPYLRAQQTWKTISPILKANNVEDCSDITPYGDSETVVEYVCALAETQFLQNILLVSHLPLVGYLTADFVTDMPPPMFPTSGMVCIDFDVDTRKGQIIWQAQP